jgi:ATP-dependent exoDNAse (exonuclease V) beta subunit
MALELIKAGRFPELVGSDISKRLRKLLSSMGAPEMTSDELCAAIDHWAEKEKQKKRKSSSADDIRDCLLVFAEAAVNLEAALARLDHLMNATGPVKLMTGHKSKGLEYPNVLILNRELLNPQKNPQDANLLYVMQTRAMHQLFYATLTDFNG